MESVRFVALQIAAEGKWRPVIIPVEKIATRAVAGFDEVLLVRTADPIVVSEGNLRPAKALILAKIGSFNYVREADADGALAKFSPTDVLANIDPKTGDMGAFSKPWRSVDKKSLLALI